MNILRTILAIAAFALAVSAHAQLSQSANYFGKIGNRDIRIAINSSGTATFQYFSAGLEEGSGSFATTGVATFSTDHNRQVTVRLQGDTATGTFLSQAFTASKESDIGPLAGISGTYSGSLLEGSGSSTS